MSATMSAAEWVRERKKRTGGMVTKRDVADHGRDMDLGA